MADLPKLPGIPSILPVKDPTIAAILRPIKESIEILGSAVSGAPLPTGQVITEGFNPSIGFLPRTDGYDPTTDFTPPPTPTGFSIAAAFQNIILEWDVPSYRNHAYTEVWRSTVNVLGTATLIGFAPGAVFADPVGTAKTFYYWIRFVSQANVIGAYNAATGTIGGTGLVGGVDLSDLIITAEKLAADAVENGKIKDAAVTTTKIANLAVGNAAIQNGAITNAKIGDLAVDSAKIADLAVVNAKIANGAITTAKIGDAEITNAKIAAAAIGTAQIQDAAITTAKIGTAQITAATIADGNITNAKIGDAQITAAKIIDGQITNAKIQDGAITNAKIGNAQIDAAKIIDGQITNAKIQDGAISNAKIGDAQITTAKIGSAQIDTLRIAGNSVTVSTSAASSAAVSYLYLTAPYGGVINIVAYIEGWVGASNQFAVFVNGANVLFFRGTEYFDGLTQNTGYTAATAVAVVGVGGGTHEVRIENQGGSGGSKPNYRVMALLTQR